MVRLNICWLLLALFCQSCSSNQTAPDIHPLRNGRITVACANTSDCTSELSAALASCASEVVIPNTGEPWSTLPLAVTCDNQHIFLQAGATILAKRGAYAEKNACLLTVDSRKGITISGEPGAGLRMWRSDYDNQTLYNHSEWRHALTLRSVCNFKIEGLTISESGGDGIYVASSFTNETVPSSNVTVINISAVRNYRQGMSVISVEGLLVQDSLFADTAGTAPMAGIDFEPNSPDNRLADMVLRNVTVKNNAGRGFQFSLHGQNQSSAPITARFEDCTVLGGNKYGFSVSGSATALPRDSRVYVDNLLVIGTNTSGLLIESKDAGLNVTFVNSAFHNVARYENAPIWIEGRNGLPTATAMFHNVSVVDNQKRAAVDFMGSVSGITGDINVINAQGCDPDPVPPGNSVQINCLADTAGSK
eukprot:m.289739 g.289739  ORF g.289739 m.289739 type:complete len:420 (-) comp19971_c0_seq11:266-1525(-)